MQLLSEDKYREALELYGPKFKAGIGAEAIRELLGELDIEKLSHELREEIQNTGSEAKRKKFIEEGGDIEDFGEGTGHGAILSGGECRRG